MEAQQRALSGVSNKLAQLAQLGNSQKGLHSIDAVVGTTMALAFGWPFWLTLYQHIDGCARSQWFAAFHFKVRALLC